MDPFRILIIDDDEDQHEILGEYLVLAGYGVEHAYDGAEGVESLRQRRADLALLDVRMPGMDGFETLKALQASPQTRGVPVLMLTSLDKSHLKVKGLELGAEDYLTKPCNKAELLARVRVALRRAPRYQRNLAAMEGNLTDLPLAELLQTLELAGRPARVRLQELGGELVLERGGALGVSFGEHIGRQALERLMLLNHGLFSVTFDEEARSPGEAPSEEPPLELRGAIMGALTRLDEVTADLAHLGGTDALVELVEPNGQPLQPAAVERLRELSPLPLRSLLVRLPGELQDNVATLVALHRDNMLRVLE